MAQGAFTGNYRDALVSSWVERCQELEIPVSAECSLRNTLASAVEVRFPLLSPVFVSGYLHRAVCVD